jgi:SAM-dependent methyltransferase
MSFYSQFADHYEKIFPFRPATLDFLRSYLPRFGRVLDFGCGTGHYTGALAALGFESMGLDLDPVMIDAARRRYPAAHFEIADLIEARSVCPTADGAFCVGNVLPHLPPDRLVCFLADLVRILPPGSPWIVQTVNYDRLLPMQCPHDLPVIEAGGGLLFRRRYEPAPGGSLHFLTELSRGEESVFSGKTALWPKSSEDLAVAHSNAGFKLIDQFGGFSKSHFEASDSGACIQVYRRMGGVPA